MSDAVCDDSGRPSVCHFTVAIEYQDPLKILSFVAQNNNSLNKSAPQGTLSDAQEPSSIEESIACADTVIHSMETSCDPSMALPHFQDLVIADVVRTFGEAVETHVAQSTEESDLQNATSILFRSVLNSVVITLFAKHATLGLCALSEMNLQLNSLGHLSAFNPREHADILQTRAETFCAYFYQERYLPFKIIALVSAGTGAVPTVAYLHPSTDAATPHVVEISKLCAADQHGKVLTGGSKQSRKNKDSSFPTKSSLPAKVQNRSATDLSLVSDGRDRRDCRKLPRSLRPSGFSRFGRDLPVETYERISERTLSILGLGEVVNHRHVLLSICQGTCPLLVAPASDEYSHASRPPTQSFRDERGVVILPKDRKHAQPCMNTNVPDALAGLFQVHVHDPSKLSSVGLERDFAGVGDEYDFTTDLESVVSSSERATRQWGERAVVALQIRPSPSGASVVVVEFSRKQEATDFKRYLSSFQKFGFLGVFKVQSARQLVSDPSQFYPPNQDPSSKESIVYPEEVTIDSLLSSSATASPPQSPSGVSKSPSLSDTSPASDASPQQAISTVGLMIQHEGVCDARGGSTNAGDNTEVGLRLFEVLASSEAGNASIPSPLAAEFASSPLALQLSLSAPHLGGINRKTGLAADDAVDFVSLYSFILRMQSEVLGSAQIKNPASHVPVLEGLLTDAMRSVGDLMKEASTRQIALLREHNSACPLEAFALSHRKAQITFEGGLLSVAAHLAPLAIYTRTLLCDMGACHTRTLSRLNRGIIRMCVSKATSLSDGLIAGALDLAPFEASILEKPLSPDETCSQAAALQDLVRIQTGIANALLSIALLFSTVAAQWDALFEKASYYAGGVGGDHAQRYTIRASTDKQSMDTKPLQDQSLRLVQAVSKYLACCANTKIQLNGEQGASESELTRGLLLAVRKRSLYYSFYNTSRPHWPLCVSWFSPPEGQQGPLVISDDYQSVSYVPFFTCTV